MKVKDTYKTISKPATGEVIKDRNSKFQGFVFPVSKETQIKQHLADLRKTQSAAHHFCYAYQLGTQTKSYRVNDDGEPNNSAGMPIYGQIQSYDLTNVLLVVIRLYGGTKLGVGGLIKAYRSAAQLALEQAVLIQRTIKSSFQITFDYRYMSKVMRILKENEIDITSQKLELNCLLEISVRKSKCLEIQKKFQRYFGVKIIEL